VPNAFAPETGNCARRPTPFPPLRLASGPRRRAKSPLSRVYGPVSRLNPPLVLPSALARPPVPTSASRQSSCHMRARQVSRRWPISSVGANSGARGAPAWTRGGSRLPTSACAGHWLSDSVAFRRCSRHNRKPDPVRSRSRGRRCGSRPTDGRLAGRPVPAHGRI
jgi:hypothetical protein